jgi:uncharacterized protein YndB with AHSA1/START domain
MTLVAKAEMLIRRPAPEVFEAFVDPAITTKFWFTRSSGRLAPGERVRWDWEMYNAHADVTVKEIEPNKRILVEWDGYGTTLVEWVFIPRPDDTTHVIITNSGFDGEDAVANALDSTGGFNLVLAGLKALLEYNVQLNIVADVHPDGVVQA